jgi:hypothetical protein
VASLVQRRIAVCTCAALVFTLAAVHAAPRVRLRLAFDTRHVLAASIRQGALAEAARIWDAHEIAIDPDDRSACDVIGPPPLLVAIDREGTAKADSSLGTIRFAPDGTPESTITLYFDAVVRIATSSPFMGLHPSLWSTGLRDEIVARALGRALAHEIGHFLLRSPHHADSGLMRASQKGSTLGALNQRPFALNEPDRARLQLALAGPVLTALVPPDTGSGCCCPVAANR